MEATYTGYIFATPIYNFEQSDSKIVSDASCNMTNYAQLPAAKLVIYVTEVKS